MDRINESTNHQGEEESQTVITEKIPLHKKGFFVGNKPELFHVKFIGSLNKD